MTADDARSVRAACALVNSHRQTTSRDMAPGPGYRHYRGLGRDALWTCLNPAEASCFKSFNGGPRWTRTTYLRVISTALCQLS